MHSRTVESFKAEVEEELGYTPNLKNDKPNIIRWFDKALIYRRLNTNNIGILRYIGAIQAALGFKDNRKAFDTHLNSMGLTFWTSDQVKSSDSISYVLHDETYAYAWNKNTKKYIKEHKLKYKNTKLKHEKDLSERDNEFIDNSNQEDRSTAKRSRNPNDDDRPTKNRRVTSDSSGGMVDESINSNSEHAQQCDQIQLLIDLQNGIGECMKRGNDFKEQLIGIAEKYKISYEKLGVFFASMGINVDLSSSKEATLNVNGTPISSFQITKKNVEYSTTTTTTTTTNINSQQTATVRTITQFTDIHQKIQQVQDEIHQLHQQANQQQVQQQLQQQLQLHTLQQIQKQIQQRQSQQGNQQLRFQQPAHQQPQQVQQPQQPQHHFSRMFHQQTNNAIVDTAQIKPLSQAEKELNWANSFYDTVKDDDIKKYQPGS